MGLDRAAKIHICLLHVHASNYYNCCIDRIHCVVSAIDYIQYLVQQKKKQEDELDSLRKEVMALKIMKA